MACEIAEALRLCGVQYLLSSNTNMANTAVSGAASSGGQNTAVSREAMTLFDGLFYFSPVTLAFLWLMVFVFEWDVVSAELHGAAAAGNPGSLLAAGSFGFLANVAGLGVVRHGGALTLTVLSLLKNGAVILLAVALYADPVTVHSVGGYTVATYGFVMYQEARAKASAAAAASQGNPGGFGDGVGGDNNVNNVNNFESGVGLVGGTAVYLGGAVPMGSVGIDLSGIERVVSGHGDGADVMSASSSARSLQVSFFFSFFLFLFHAGDWTDSVFCVQRTASGHVVNTVLGLPKLKTGRSTGGGAKAGVGKSKGGSGGGGDKSPRRRTGGNVDKEREPLIP